MDASECCSVADNDSNFTEPESRDLDTDIAIPLVLEMANADERGKCAGFCS